MKIAFLSYLHGFGGAEKQNVMLANAMAERGHDVTLISICVNNRNYQLDKRVKYIFLPDRKNNTLRIVTRYQDIKKKLVEIKPDVTVNFWFQSAYMCAWMKKDITGKVIYSERGDPGDKEYSGVLGLIRTLSFPRIDGFVFQSKGAQNYFNQEVQNRSIVIPNPVYVKKSDFPEVYKRRKAIVTVGRLHEQKNQKMLIEAFSLVANRLPAYTLEIYGEGELKDELQQLISSKNLQNRVFLMGTSAEIHKRIYDASLFVLSSDYEGLPNTLMEAMTLGIPCIATDCRPGGARDIIHDKEDGIIVPLNNREKLSEAILYMLSDSVQANEMGEIASKAMLRYNSDKIYAKWENYFCSVYKSSHV